MRVRDLHAEVSSPGRAAPYADEDAWCTLVDALVSAVRDEERASALATLNRLVIAARALPTSEAVARLIAGIATRDYTPTGAPVAEAHSDAVATHVVHAGIDGPK